MPGTRASTYFLSSFRKAASSSIRRIFFIFRPLFPSCNTASQMHEINRSRTFQPLSVELLRLKEHVDNVRQALHQLSMAFMDEQPDLGGQRIGDRELGQGKAGYRELAHADHSHPELRNGNDAASKLPDRNDAFCHDRRAVRAVLE